MKMLKYVFLVIFCLIYKNAMGKTQFSEEQKQMIKNLHSSCVTETNVPESLIDAANSGNFGNERSLKCYMKCLMTSIGVMEEDGTMDFDAYLELLPENLREFGEKTIAKCKNIEPEGDACETAYKIHRCGYEADPTQYLLF